MTSDERSLSMSDVWPSWTLYRGETLHGRIRIYEMYGTVYEVTFLYSIYEFEGLTYGILFIP